MSIFLNIVRFILGMFLCYLMLCFVGPKTLYFERSIGINADKQTVYNHIRSIKKLKNWSTFHQLPSKMPPLDPKKARKKIIWGTPQLEDTVTNKKVVTNLQIKAAVNLNVINTLEIQEKSSNYSEVHSTFSTHYGFWNRPIFLFVDLEAKFETELTSSMKNLKVEVEEDYEMQRPSKYIIETDIQKEQIYFGEKTKWPYSAGDSDYFQNIRLNIKQKLKQIETNNFRLNIFYGNIDTLNQAIDVFWVSSQTLDPKQSTFKELFIPKREVLNIKVRKDSKVDVRLRNVAEEYAKDHNLSLENNYQEIYQIKITEKDTSIELKEVIYPIKKQLFINQNRN